MSIVTNNGTYISIGHICEIEIRSEQRSNLEYTRGFKLFGISIIKPGILTYKIESVDSVLRSGKYRMDSNNIIYDKPRIGFSLSNGEWHYKYFDNNADMERFIRSHKLYESNIDVNFIRL